MKNFRANGKRKLLKNPEFKVHWIQWKFWGQTSVFQGKRKLLKNPEFESIFNTVNLGQLCFSGQAQVAKKSWM